MSTTPSPQPDDPVALRSLAAAARSRGDNAAVVALLSRASRADPDNAGLLLELGLAYRDGERPDAARYVLERAVALGGDPGARLMLAHVLELDERPEPALLQYCRALADAQRTRWPGAAAATATGELVLRAEAYVRNGRRAWFDAALHALRERHGGARWDRVDDALAMYLHERDVPPGGAERPRGFLFVPRLATARHLDASRFDWPIARAAGLIAPLAEEVDGCLGGVGERPGRLPILLRGIPQYEARRAPRLVAALTQLPLVHIANHAPDAEIVQVPAGARIPPHVGGMNSRCRIIVNLAYSVPMGISVGGEGRSLAPGEVLAFDPGSGVEYASLAPAQARAVVFDAWHPDLSSVEREALSALILAAIEFDTRMQELP